MKGKSLKPAAAGSQDIHPARILALCQTRHIARRIVLFDVVGSTNAVALSAAAGGQAPETLFIAEEQRSGRGRKGRSWLSTKGRSLTVSLLLSPPRKDEGLTAIMALAVVRALDSSVKGIAIKWPNDIFLKGRKLGGILAESRDEFVAIGLGLNVNEGMREFPPEIAGEAISMRVAAGKRFDRGLVLCRLLVEFERLYDKFQETGFAPFRDEIQRRLLYLGEGVVVDVGGTKLEGTMTGITNEGYVCLDVDGTERIMSSGDLTLRRMRGA
jgi:BirA family biotin operon repressor/biotin-[acetyl-CoA-carboxylase] ligase